jgi:hypothetical protein
MIKAESIKLIDPFQLLKEKSIKITSKSAPFLIKASITPFNANLLTLIVTKLLQFTPNSKTPPFTTINSEVPFHNTSENKNNTVVTHIVM